MLASHQKVMMIVKMMYNGQKYLQRKMCKLLGVTDHVTNIIFTHHDPLACVLEIHLR